MSEATMSDSKLAKELFVRGKALVFSGGKCIFLKKAGKLAVVINNGGEGKMVCVSVQELLDYSKKAQAGS